MTRLDDKLLAGLRRKLAYRRRHYPKLVRVGWITQADADRKLANLEATLAAYEAQVAAKPKQEVLL